jgi:hypothetical protein
MRNFVHLNTEQISPYIKDDPVRPHISAETRTTGNRTSFALVEGSNVLAIICCAFTYGVPTTEDDLDNKDGFDMIVSPYTVWSYSKGAGREIIFNLLEFVKQEHKEMDKKYWPRIVTLSPKTEMAEKFHLKNGAVLLSENDTTNNFEYIP